MKELAIIPFIYIRIDRAGKRIGLQYANRYYSSAGYGINILATKFNTEVEQIPSDKLLENSIACSLDNSTYIKSPININQISPELKELLLSINIDNLLNNITKFISVRTGDIIAIETQHIESCKKYLYPQEITTKIIPVDLNNIVFNIIF